MKITLIAAIGKNNELGSNNKLLWHIPEDFQWFKAKTMGKTMIMGRNTMDSLGKPLKNRENWVLTRDLDRVKEGFQGFTTWEAVFDKAAEIQLHELMVIGGAEIYRHAIDFADELIITHVNTEFPEADVFFPNIDLEFWMVSEEILQTQIEDTDLRCRFVTYKRR
jgi:dihydrofolate reductase